MNFSCRTCTAAQQIARGCTADAPAPVVTLDGEDLFRCPLVLLANATFQVLALFGAYENGLLPIAGGLLDQSATFLEAVRLLRGEVAEYRAKH